mgnify:CR=1 FL=1
MPIQERVTEDGLDIRYTEDNVDARVTEFTPDPRIQLSTIIIYSQVGSSNLRVRPIFNYEFPVQLYMVVTD